MAAAHDRLVVIAGGPGAGKTTLIEALRERGFAVAPEAGRAIIKDQVAIGGTALPWADAALMAEVSLAWEMRTYGWALEQPGTVFFDHAVPSIAAYHEMMTASVPEHVTNAIERCRYHRRVFVAPPWPEIFCNDAERRQTYAQAVRGHAHLVAAYPRYGYELVELPRCDVAGRVDFVLDVLAG